MTLVFDCTVAGPNANSLVSVAFFRSWADSQPSVDLSNVTDLQIEAAIIDIASYGDEARDRTRRRPMILPVVVET